MLKPISRNTAPPVLYTLIVDGKKLSVGTSSAFKHLRDLHGIHLQRATYDDIAGLTVHPGTPASARQAIKDFIESRNKRQTYLSSRGRR